MNIFHARFATGVTVEASGVPSPTLQSWLKRDLIVGHKDNPIEGGGSQGAHRRFSFHNVMALAIAKALLDAGLGSVPQAIAAGIGFSHVAGQIGNEPDRAPALPFDTRTVRSQTLLAVAGDKHAAIAWQHGKDVFELIRQRLGRPVGFVVIEIDPIFQRVVQRLGHNYHDVLEIAYPGQPIEPTWDDAAIDALIPDTE